MASHFVSNRIRNKKSWKHEAIEDDESDVRSLLLDIRRATQSVSALQPIFQGTSYLSSSQAHGISPPLDISDLEDGYNANSHQYDFNTLREPKSRQLREWTSINEQYVYSRPSVDARRTTYRTKMNDYHSRFSTDVTTQELCQRMDECLESFSNHARVFEAVTTMEPPLPSHSDDSDYEISTSELSESIRVFIYGKQWHIKRKVLRLWKKYSDRRLWIRKTLSAWSRCTKRLKYLNQVLISQTIQRNQVTLSTTFHRWKNFLEACRNVRNHTIPAWRRVIRMQKLKSETYFHRKVELNRLRNSWVKWHKSVLITFEKQRIATTHCRFRALSAFHERWKCFTVQSKLLRTMNSLLLREKLGFTFSIWHSNTLLARGVHHFRITNLCDTLGFFSRLVHRRRTHALARRHHLATLWQSWRQHVHKKQMLANMTQRIHQTRSKKWLAIWFQRAMLSQRLRTFEHVRTMTTKRKHLLAWSHLAQLCKAAREFLMHSKMKIRFDVFSAWKGYTISSIAGRAKVMSRLRKVYHAWYLEANVVVVRFKKLRYRKWFQGWVELVNQKYMKKAAFKMAGIHSRLALVCRCFHAWRVYREQRVQHRKSVTLGEQFWSSRKLRLGIQSLREQVVSNRKLARATSHFERRCILNWHARWLAKCSLRRLCQRAQEHHTRVQMRIGLNQLIRNANRHRLLQKAIRVTVTASKMKVWRQWRNSFKIRITARMVAQNAKNHIRKQVIETWKEHYLRRNESTKKHRKAESFHEFVTVRKMLRAWNAVAQKIKTRRIRVENFQFQKYVVRACVVSLQHWKDWAKTSAASRQKLVAWKHLRERKGMKHSKLGLRAKFFFHWKLHRESRKLEIATGYVQLVTMRCFWARWKKVVKVKTCVRSVLRNWHQVARTRARVYPGMAQARNMVIVRRKLHAKHRTFNAWYSRYVGQVNYLLRVQHQLKVVCTQIRGISRIQLLHERNLARQVMRGWSTTCRRKQLKFKQFHIGKLKLRMFRMWAQNALNAIGHRLLQQIGIPKPNALLKDEMQKDWNNPKLSDVRVPLNKDATVKDDVSTVLLDLWMKHDYASCLRIIFHCYENPRQVGLSMENYWLFCRDFGLLNDDFTPTKENTQQFIKRANCLRLEDTHFGDLLNQKAGYFHPSLCKPVGVGIPQGCALPGGISNEKKNPQISPVIGWLTFVKCLILHLLERPEFIEQCSPRRAGYIFRMFLENVIFSRMEISLRSTPSSTPQLSDSPEVQFAPLAAPLFLFHSHVQNVLHSYRAEIRTLLVNVTAIGGAHQAGLGSSNSGNPAAHRDGSRNGEANRKSRAPSTWELGDLMLVGTKCSIAPELCSIQELSNLTCLVQAVYLGTLSYVAVEELLVQVASRFVTPPLFGSVTEECQAACVRAGIGLAVKLRVLLLSMDSTGKLFQGNTVALHRMGVVQVTQSAPKKATNKPRKRFRRHSTGGEGYGQAAVAQSRSSFGEDGRRKDNGRPTNLPRRRADSMNSNRNPHNAQPARKASPFAQENYTARFYRQRSQQTKKMQEKASVVATCSTLQDGCLVSPARKPWGTWKRSNPNSSKTELIPRSAGWVRGGAISSREAGHGPPGLGTTETKSSGLTPLGSEIGDAVRNANSSIALLSEEATKLEAIRISHPMLDQLTGPSAPRAAQVIVEAGASRSKPDMVSLDLGTGSDYKMGVRWARRQVARHPGPMLSEQQEVLLAQARYEELVPAGTPEEPSALLSEQVTELLNGKVAVEQ